MHSFSIMGGGIAGLATAIAMQRKGIDVQVYEASTQLKPVGAGLTLASNAMQALRRLELYEEVEQAGARIDAFNIYNKRGSLINRTHTAGLYEQYGAGNLAIHRADLHRILLSHLQPGTVITGKRSTGLQKSPNGYRIDFTDGESVETRYLIVAEGIHSPIRKQLFPQSTIRFAGCTCWRGIVKLERDMPPEASETWGNRGRFGIVPIGNGLVYWFATAPVNQPNSNYSFYTANQLGDHFRQYHHPIPEIIANTDPEAIIWNDIYDLKPLPGFAQGNCLLIGDAAHATTPNMGQGACMALEDAVVLACCLSQNSIVADAFTSFEQKRMARTRWVTEASWRLGKMAEMTHPAWAAVRDTLFRLMPQSAYKRQVERLYRVSFD